VRRSYLTSGDAYIWISAGATGTALLLILGVLFLVAKGGLGVFWPDPLIEYTLEDGGVVLGQKWNEESISDAADAEMRVLVRAGNRRIRGTEEFVWLRDSEIRSIDSPREAVLIERTEYGDFVGYVDAYHVGDQVTARGAAAWEVARRRLREVHELRARIRSLERGELGRISSDIETRRREIRRIELGGNRSVDAARIAELENETTLLEGEYEGVSASVGTLREELEQDRIAVRTAEGRAAFVPMYLVERLLEPNAMSWGDRMRTYASRFWGFVSDEPREANLAGGIFPAIYGTVLMTLLMTLLVVPLGAVAGLYLREYAKQGPLVRIVRIAVNNLAGVPSIVFGVFGLGFFIYFVGSSIDNAFFPEVLPTPTFGTGGILWAALTLALLTVPVVIVATEEGLAAVPRAVREGSLALGASKWETTWKIVLPAASPGILTGVILAIARAAGEVAPLMLVGAVKLATELPVDATAPFLHLQRKFMHLGFHIYDVGFQSPNVEAAKPMVYMTTLLLVAIVVLLNVSAMWIRNRLRSRYRSASF
jgi:phosphate transport system permease protein